MVFEVGTLGDTWVPLAVWTGLFYFGRLACQNGVQSFVKGGKRVRKGKEKPFSESVWKLLFYSVFWVFGVQVGWDIFTDPTLTFVDYPAWFPTYGYRLYVLGQLGFYTASLIHHVDGTEEVRSDWWEMLGHHVVTVGLVYASYAMNLGYWAVVVFTLHDICDVTLESAKILGYFEWNNPSTAMWIVTLVLWTYLRVYLFFFKVLLVVWHGPDKLAAYRPGFLVALSVIYALNCFWETLLVRGFTKVLLGKDKARDIRED